jgi:hypothetical protein
MLLKNAENNKDHYFIIYPINSKMKNGRREEKNNDILRKQILMIKNYTNISKMTNYLSPENIEYKT